MIICHCRVVRDTEIRTQVRSGARTTEEVTRRCGAGAECGTCLPAVVDIIDEEIERIERDVDMLSST